MNTDSESSKDTAIRTFIAIDIDAHTLEYFHTFQQQQSKERWYKTARWTKDDNIHLTLRFLGSINPQQLALIKSGMAQFSTYDRFDIHFSQPQPFPSLRKPRTLAALVHKNDALMELARTAETIAVNAGLEPEHRSFTGHITVARFRKRPRGLEGLLKNTQTRSLTVQEVVLYQSYLEPQGARYKKLVCQSLK